MYIRIYYVVNLKRSTPRQEEITRPVNAVLKSVFVKTQQRQGKNQMSLLWILFGLNIGLLQQITHTC